MTKQKYQITHDNKSAVAEQNLSIPLLNMIINCRLILSMEILLIFENQFFTT